jgi:TatD DNase family protein
MKYIDTHCHLNFAIYHDDIQEVITRTIEQQVAVINIGTQASTSLHAAQLAQDNSHFWAIIGLHPIHTMASFHDNDELGNEGEEFTSRGELFDPVYYRGLLDTYPKIVGIGECGLDYYRIEAQTKEVQERAFRSQIELALEYDLPLMLHVRPSQGSYDAYEDVLEILSEYKKENPSLRGQVHFFAGTKDLIDSFLALGFYISFTGVVTFAPMYTELVAHVPLNKILSETDAPYVSPAPFRGKRNEPIHVQEVVKKISEIHNIDSDTIAEQIKMNVAELYRINF